MIAPYVVVEGVVDELVVRSILASRGITPTQIIITNGKSTLNARLARYNQAAHQFPWIVLRDADQDAQGCPVDLRRQLLRVRQAPKLCLRLAVRTVEAWLLADAEAFATFFSISHSAVPRLPEQLDRPKDALVAACRKSRRKAVRIGMAPPAGTRGTGPEYSAFVGDYIDSHWRPDVAASSADSLRRAIEEIDRLSSDGTW